MNELQTPELFVFAKYILENLIWIVNVMDCIIAGR